MSKPFVLKQHLAIAVRDGRAQLQRVTAGAPNGGSTVEALSQWRPVEFMNLKALEENVRMANTGAKVALAKAFHEFSKEVRFKKRKGEK